MHGTVECGYDGRVLGHSLALHHDVLDRLAPYNVHYWPPPVQRAIASDPLVQLSLGVFQVEHTREYKPPHKCPVDVFEAIKASGNHRKKP